MTKTFWHTFSRTRCILERWEN